MSELFFSYALHDQDRVVPIARALEEQDFQIVLAPHSPEESGTNDWITGPLTSARACIVFWSLASAALDQVKRQAKYAQDHEKLIAVNLDVLRKTQIPDGLVPDKEILLAHSQLNETDPEWQKLFHAIQEKVTPLWVQALLSQRDQEIVEERTRTQTALANCEQLTQQLEKEIADHNLFRQSRATVFSDAEQAKAALEETQASLAQQRAEREVLQKQIRVQNQQRFTLAQLLMAGLLAFLIGAGGVYAFVALPLQKKMGQSEQTLKQIQQDKVSGLQTIETLKADALAKDKRYNLASNQIKTLRLDLSQLNEKLALAESQLKTSEDLLEKGKQKQLATQLHFETASRELNELKNMLVASQKEIDRTKYALSIRQQKLEQAEAKLKVAEQDLSILKQNAYREISSLKKTTAREISTLKRKISQLNTRLQKLPKSKPAGN